MSASLPKISNLLSTNNLCYYKIPLEYNDTTDTHKYTFTVAANSYDPDFNTHLIDVVEYLPNAYPEGEKINVYKKVAIISGSQDIGSINDRGITIKTPIGIVKKRSDEIFSDSDVASGQQDSILCAGFTGNSIDIGSYSMMNDIIRDSNQYHGGVTGYNDDISDYWTFIASAVKWNELSDGTFVIEDGFNIIGCTASKMSIALISQNLQSVAGSDYEIKVVPLSYGKDAQMYYVDSGQLKVPSSLPAVEFRTHDTLISNAVVIWEQQTAFVPAPFYSKNADATAKKYATNDFIKIQNLSNSTVPRIDCYIQPSETSAKIGSLSTNNTYYNYYDLYTTYNSAGELEAWFRIGDSDSGNNCWIKYTATGISGSSPKIYTNTFSQDEFYFRINNTVDYYNEFDWQYSVVTITNDTSYSNNNSYFTSIKGNWSNFVWDDFYTITNNSGQYLAALTDDSNVYQVNKMTYTDELTDFALWKIEKSADTDGYTFINKGALNNATQYLTYNANFYMANPSTTTANDQSLVLYKEVGNNFVYNRNDELPDEFTRFVLVNNAPTVDSNVQVMSLTATTGDRFTPIQVAATVSGDDVTITGPIENAAVLTITPYNKLDDYSDIFDWGPKANTARIDGRQATWVKTQTANTDLSVLYIRATVKSSSNLMPYQVSYLDADVSPSSVYFGTDNWVGTNAQTDPNPYYGRYTYIFKYIVPKAETINFYNEDGTTIAARINKSGFSALEIDPYIKDNMVQLYANVNFDTSSNPGVKPIDVGYLDFKQVITENNITREVDGVNNRFPRGSTIKVYGYPKNGWSFDNVEGGDSFILPTQTNYEVYVVTGNFSRKTESVSIEIINTNRNLGSIVLPDFPYASRTINGDEEIIRFNCAEDDTLRFVAIPNLFVDSEGVTHNTSSLARWEYSYNISETNTEWRLICDERDYEFKIHLWQSEGSNISKKYNYKYRAIWGQACIIY